MKLDSYIRSHKNGKCIRDSQVVNKRFSGVFNKCRFLYDLFKIYQRNKIDNKQNDFSSKFKFRHELLNSPIILLTVN